MRFLGLSRDNTLILLSMLFWGSGEGLWYYVQPLYIKGLGADSMEIGLVMSLGPVLMVLGFVPAGIIADRYGRKRIMLGGCLMGVLSVIVLALARNWQQSIPGFLLYFASACGLPAFQAYIARASEGRSLNRTFSVIYAAFALGLIVFPTVGGWLAESVGFPPVLLLAAVSYAVSTLMVILIREQPVEGPQQALGFREVTSNRHLVMLCVLSVFVFLALYLGQPFAPNYLQEVVGIDLSWIGFLGSAHALGATVLGVALGRVSEGIAGFVLGQALVALSLVLMVNVRAMPLLFVVFFLRGAYNACRALVLALGGKVVGETSVGLAYGMLNSAVGVSMVLAPYVAAWLYTTRNDLPFVVAAGMIAVTMVVSVAFLRDNGAKRRTST
jgi:DHA1 family multidrug resistance protein-like MFS transporter